MLEKWYSVELTKDKAELFKKYLHEHCIDFEPSEAHNFIHFECLMDLKELDAANEWLLEVIANG